MRTELDLWKFCLFVGSLVAIAILVEDRIDFARWGKSLGIAGRSEAAAEKQAHAPPPSASAPVAAKAVTPPVEAAQPTEMPRVVESAPIPPAVETSSADSANASLAGKWSGILRPFRSSSGKFNPDKTIPFRLDIDPGLKAGTFWRNNESLRMIITQDGDELAIRHHDDPAPLLKLRMKLDASGNMAEAVLRFDYGADGWGEAKGKLDRL